MAGSMMSLQKKVLIELLEDIPDDKTIGYLFSAKADLHSPEHQTIVLFEPIKPI